MMLQKGFLETIATLTAKGATGRLDIVAGTTDGALLFANGKLVDARLGHLTGFQAINAVASMPDARFHFDSSVGVPTFSSITSSERHVLKQFFGIETADANDHAMPVIIDEDDEATLVTSGVSSTATSPVTSAAIPAATSTPMAAVAANRTRSRSPYLIAVAASVLILAIAAGAVLLRNRLAQQSAEPAVATTTTEPVAPPAAPATTETAKPAPSIQDLNGKWNVVNTVHNTRYRAYQNLQIGFAVSINQNGTSFTAEGQKVSENGRSLPESSRTPIHLKGVIDGDRIEATFYEDGAARKTNGRFVWKIDRAGGGLTGTFDSTAARTSGKSTARREL